MLCKGSCIAAQLYSSGRTLQEAVEPTLLLWPQPSMFRASRAKVHLTSYERTNTLYYLILLNKVLGGVSKINFLI